MGRGGAAFPTAHQVGRGRRQPGPPALRGLQRRRVRARHLQGPGADGAGPVRARRGADRSWATPAGPSRATSTSAASTRRRRRGCARRRARPAARGFLGPDVMGEGFAFDIEVRRGAGAYIAGEETALINSLEGKRAEPRNKPPFPAQSGLFGKPTAVNNVETLLSVLEILRVGGPAFAQVGTADSTGTRLFCLSGCVAVPGLYEYDFGVTLRDVIDGGGRRARRAAAAGGAARRRGRRVRRARRARHAADLRGGARRGRHARLRRRARARRHGGRAGPAAPDRPVLPRRVLRPVRALPGRHGPPGGTGRRGWRAAPRSARSRTELALLADIGHGRPRRVDLRPRPDRAVGGRSPRSSSASSAG